MALGLGFGCCCRGQCAELRNCDTLETITTTSDLSAYSVGVVLRRDASEDGGCWELLSLTAQCGDSPETFTVDTGPFTGETACADCLSGGAPPDGCQSCGDDQALEGSNAVTVDWLFQDFSFGTAENENGAETIYLGGGHWRATKTITCGEASIDLRCEWFCSDGQWTAELWANDVSLGAIEPDHSGVTAWGPGMPEVLEDCADPILAGIFVTWHHIHCTAGGGDE